MHKIVCFALGILMLAASPPTLAAKRLGPPIEELQSAPKRVRIVVAEAREKPEAGKILFAVTGEISGKSPDELLLRTDEQTFIDVKTGQSYVVVWTDKRRGSSPGKRWETDPDGPATLQTTAVGATTVFEDTPELRFLFAPATMADDTTAGRQLDALLTQMQREDPRSRGLVITELLLRDDLTALMGPEQITIVKNVLETADLEPLHRDYLLRSALRLPSEVTAPWLAEQFRKVIILNGTQYDLASFVPALVRTAARGLQQVGEPPDIALLGTLLYSNNPGVAKAALAAMDHFGPETAAGKARQALARGWIHGETRLALEHYLTLPARSSDD